MLEPSKPSIILLLISTSRSVWSSSTIIRPEGVSRFPMKDSKNPGKHGVIKGKAWRGILNRKTFSNNLKAEGSVWAQSHVCINPVPWECPSALVLIRQNMNLNPIRHHWGYNRHPEPGTASPLFNHGLSGPPGPMCKNPCICPTCQACSGAEFYKSLYHVQCYRTTRWAILSLKKSDGSACLTS